MKRILALFLFCLLTMSGLTSAESTPLCAQIAPQCCCIEPDAASTVADHPQKLNLATDVLDATVSVSGLEVGAADSEIASLLSTVRHTPAEPSDVSSIGHEDCCCVSSEGPPAPADSAVQQFGGSPVDLAAGEVRTAKFLHFPLYDNLLTNGPSSSTRPIHLATNKVYLLKRSLLI